MAEEKAAPEAKAKAAQTKAAEKSTSETAQSTEEDAREAATANQVERANVRGGSVGTVQPDHEPDENGYVGVSQEYRNYANDTDKPYNEVDEEAEQAAAELQGDTHDVEKGREVHRQALRVDPPVPVRDVDDDHESVVEEKRAKSTKKD